MPIYTKQGDTGQSTLIDGCKTPKNDPIFRVLNDLDQVNSYLGICISLGEEKQIIELNSEWKLIQKKLFSIGSQISKVQQPRNQIIAQDLNFLEQQIDKMMSKCQPLHNFIIPNGHILTSHLHFVRALIRSLEQSYFNLTKKPDNDLIGPYINRLSDYFFAASRYINYITNTPEIIWE